MTRGLLGPQGHPETPRQEGERRKTESGVCSGRHARFPRSRVGTLRPLLGPGDRQAPRAPPSRGGRPVRHPHPLHGPAPGAQTAGPWTGTGLLWARARLPQPRGPSFAPRQGGGCLPGTPLSTRAGVSLHLRHSCTQGALPTCTPQALLPEAPAGPSEHSLPAPGPSVHPCLPARLGESGAQSPVPSPNTPLPQHDAQPEGTGMPSPCPF